MENLPRLPKVIDSLNAVLTEVTDVMRVDPNNSLYLQIATRTAASAPYAQVLWNTYNALGLPVAFPRRFFDTIIHTQALTVAAFYDIYSVCYNFSMPWINRSEMFLINANTLGYVICGMDNDKTLRQYVISLVKEDDSYTLLKSEISSFTEASHRSLIASDSSPQSIVMAAPIDPHCSPYPDMWN